MKPLPDNDIYKPLRDVNPEVKLHDNVKLSKREAQKAADLISNVKETEHGDRIGITTSRYEHNDDSIGLHFHGHGAYAVFDDSVDVKRAAITNETAHIETSHYSTVYNLHFCEVTE